MRSALNKHSSVNHTTLYSVANEVFCEYFGKPKQVLTLFKIRFWYQENKVLQSLAQDVKILWRQNLSTYRTFGWVLCLTDTIMYFLYRRGTLWRCKMLPLNVYSFYKDITHSWLWECDYHILWRDASNIFVFWCWLLKKTTNLPLPTLTLTF